MGTYMPPRPEARQAARLTGRHWLPENRLTVRMAELPHAKPGAPAPGRKTPENKAETKRKRG